MTTFFVLIYFLNPSVNDLKCFYLSCKSKIFSHSLSLAYNRFIYRSLSLSFSCYYWYEYIFYLPTLWVFSFAFYILYFVHSSILISVRILFTLLIWAFFWLLVHSTIMLFYFDPKTLLWYNPSALILLVRVGFVCFSFWSISLPLCYT